MKTMKAIFVGIFILFMLVPVVLLNREADAISAIDNKVLAANPFSSEAQGDLTEGIERYLSERLGFRDKAILYYTVANDVLFGTMIHPSYAYGEDGYIFSRPGANVVYDDFQEAFVHMLSEIQAYCDSKDIPFVFVFEPNKASVLGDKLMRGYNYNNDWVGMFTSRLDEEGINYVDNTATLAGCRDEGVEVFNVKYNANHWNDTGAFYGMNATLDKLSELGAKVHVNQLDEYRVEQHLNTTLPVSEFPIEEYEPKYYLIKDDIIENLTDDYENEVIRDDRYQGFGYYRNSERMAEECDRALVFQGSYINGMGYKFLQNAFGEYIHVHDYQNILNIEYYVNIFKPECIVLDAAEYTFSSKYFDYDGMTSFKLNPSFDTYDEYGISNIETAVDYEEGDKLITLEVSGLDGEADYGYCIANGEIFDAIKNVDENGNSYYTLTLMKTDCDDEVRFCFVNTSERVKYVVNARVGR